MADNDDLTPEQTEKLALFQEVSGIEDIEQCKNVLRQNNWDMEVAVQGIISEQEGLESIFNEPQVPLHNNVQPAPHVDVNPVDQRAEEKHANDSTCWQPVIGIFTVDRRRPVGIIEWIWQLALFPFQFAFSTIWSFFNFALSLFRPDPRTNPLGDVRSFIKQFSDRYGNVHPTFFANTYSQALNEAKRDLKFLLVYLHSDSHQDTDFFCRNTLCDQGVVDFVNSHALFWACSVNTPEGYRVSQALKENTYPFLALIVLRQNRMTVVARLEGPIDSRTLCARLQRLMDDNEGSLHAARLEREERSFNQSLREQQDEAYLESLRADQEKARLKQETEERERQSAQAAIDNERKEQQRREEIRCRKEEFRQNLPAEPDADHPDTVKILLKLPNGIRLERRFCKTDALQSLYDFVFVHESAPDDFQIVTNFPRRVLPGRTPINGTDFSSQPVTFADFGLGRSEMLFVHDNEA